MCIRDRRARAFFRNAREALIALLAGAAFYLAPFSKLTSVLVAVGAGRVSLHRRN